MSGSQRGMTAREYIGYLLFGVALSIVVVALGIPWAATIFGVLIVLATFARALTVNTVRARKRRELEGPG